jgi:hypothetical protein
MLLFPDLDAPFNRMTRPGRTAVTGQNLSPHHQVPRPRHPGHEIGLPVCRCLMT